MRSSGKLLLALALTLAAPAVAQTLSAGGCTTNCTFVTSTLSGGTLSGTTTLPGSGQITNTGALTLGGAQQGSDALTVNGVIYGSGAITSANTGFVSQGMGTGTLFGDSLTGDTATAFTIKGTNVSAPNTAAQNIAITAPNASGTGGTSNGGSIVLTPGTSTNGTGGFVRLANTTTGTNADFLCLDSSGDILLQTSACTISSMRFKENIEPLETDALSIIAQLQPVTFNMKPGSTPNPDPNFGRNQIGLIAENVAAVDPRMAIYENDGVTPKSYRQESVIAALVAAVNELQACKLRVMGHCWF